MAQDQELKENRMLTILLVLCVIFAVAEHLIWVEPARVLNDFESDGDLSRLNWKCHTLYALSATGTSHGRSALELMMYPSAYPGVSFKHVPKNWKAYTALCVDVTNPGSTDVSLVLRIDDKEDALDYEDRFNHRLTIKPGMNSVRIPVDSLVCPSGRTLDTRRIHSLMFFTVNPPEPVSLYMDHLRLMP